MSNITSLLGTPQIGQNVLVNGNFDIWARGTSTTSAGAYLADRWVSSGGVESYSQGTSTPQTGSLYYAVYTRTTATSGSLVLNQRIESANTRALNGQLVTLSFYFRQPSGTTTACKVRIDSANAVDSFGGITTQIAETTVLATPDNTWQKVSYSFTVNSTMAANGFQILIGNLATTGPVTFNLAQVKLEVGASATPFSLAGGSIGGEDLLCKRYYERSYGAAATELQGLIWNNGQNDVTLATGFTFLATKRRFPDITIYAGNGSGTAGSVNTGVGLRTVTSIADIGINRVGRVYFNTTGVSTWISYHFEANAEL
jgi:hypothetical protein